MTWIKPSLLWMAYRSGWATKASQERILAVEITRDGFDWALGHSCLSHFDQPVHGTPAVWQRQMLNSPVRVQWDPERSITLDPLQHRSIQIGIGGPAVDRYINDWTLGLTDITEHVHQIHELVRAGELEEARARLPYERPYPVAQDAADRIAANAAVAT